MYLKNLKLFPERNRMDISQESLASLDYVDIHGYPFNVLYEWEQNTFWWLTPVAFYQGARANS